MYITDTLYRLNR